MDPNEPVTKANLFRHLDAAWNRLQALMGRLSVGQHLRSLCRAYSLD